MDKTQAPEEAKQEYLSPYGLLKMIKPILAEELIANFRIERDGMRITFCNGQKFRLKIDEIR